MMEKNRAKFLLLLIVVLAAFLRFYRLAEVPPSLFGDEVDVGYQAYSILRTGRDYSGNFLPIHFQSLADWRTPLFLYATVPFVWLFGLTELGVRFLPALMGVLTIPAMYLLVKELFANFSTSQESPPAIAWRRSRWRAGKSLLRHLRGVSLQVSLPLIAALLLAISPWHLQYSRAAFEVTLMLFLVILGVWGFLRGLRKKNALFLVLSSLFFALAPYSYNTAKLFIPLFVGLLVFCFWKRVKKVEKKKVGLAIFVFVLVSLPMGYDIFFGQGGSRFAILSIFTDPTVVPQIGFERLVDARTKLEEVPLGFQPSLASRFFHNKFLSWGTAFLTNYFRAFSTEFLFTFGDINFRHSIQGGFGQLYWLEAVFLLLGIFWVIREIGGKREKGEKLFLLGWLLLAPIPSALTRDGGNHATRLILMLPPLLIFVSLGILGFLGGLSRGAGSRFAGGSKRKKIFGVFLLITGYWLLITLYLHRYYVHWPWESERWWHPGFKEAVSYAKEHNNEYDYIIFSEQDENPLIFFLFWSGFNPQEFQATKFQYQELTDAIVAKRLGETKYYFGAIKEERLKSGWLAGTLKPNILYIAPEGEIGKDLRKMPLPSNVKLLKIIKFPSGEPAKYILTGL